MKCGGKGGEKGGEKGSHVETWGTGEEGGRLHGRAAENGTGREPGGRRMGRGRSPTAKPRGTRTGRSGQKHGWAAGNRDRMGKMRTGCEVHDLYVRISCCVWDGRRKGRTFAEKKEITPCPIPA